MATNSKAKSDGKQLPTHFWMTFYLSRSVYTPEQLNTLHRLIVEMLQQWSSELTVLKNEDKRTGRRVGHAGSLAAEIEQEAPTRRGIGSAVLKGAYKGVSFYLSTCASTLPPELNRICVEVERNVVEGEDFSAWSYRFFEAAVARLPIRYANAHLDEEFRAKNLVSDENGARAIGVRFHQALPGIYWLNYFGDPYVKLIGRDRLLSAPAWHVREISNGVLASLCELPHDWATEKYRLRETEVTNHIGDRYFFSRNIPDRETIAPTFSRETG